MNRPVPRHCLEILWHAGTCALAVPAVARTLAARRRVAAAVEAFLVVGLVWHCLAQVTERPTLVPGEEWLQRHHHRHHVGNAKCQKM